MTARRLSAVEALGTTFVCEHVCCTIPLDPNHQHLFPSSECPVCRETWRAAAIKENRR